MSVVVCKTKCSHTYQPWQDLPGTRRPPTQNGRKQIGDRCIAEARVLFLALFYGSRPHCVSLNFATRPSGSSRLVCLFFLSVFVAQWVWAIASSVAVPERGTLCPAAHKPIPGANEAFNFLPFMINYSNAGGGEKYNHPCSDLPQPHSASRVQTL